MLINQLAIRQQGKKKKKQTLPGRGKTFKWPKNIQKDF